MSRGRVVFVVAVLAVVGLVVAPRLLLGSPNDDARVLRAALAPACSGHPEIGAGTAGHASVTTTPTFQNHFVILDIAGNEHEWSGNDYRWTAATVADTELVVCIAADQAFTPVGVCSYEHGMELRKHDGSRSVAVFEASTGQEFASFEVAVEHDNSCPPKMVGKAGSSSDGYRGLDFAKDVQPALDCLPGGRAWHPRLGCQATE